MEPAGSAEEKTSQHRRLRRPPFTSSGSQARGDEKGKERAGIKLLRFRDGRTGSRRSRGRGAAGIVRGRGGKWICMGAIYWLDGRRGAQGVVSDRGRREKSESSGPSSLLHFRGGAAARRATIFMARGLRVGEIAAKLRPLLHGEGDRARGDTVRDHHGRGGACPHEERQTECRLCRLGPGGHTG